MYVYFTTGEDVSNVTLELGHADEAATYFTMKFVYLKTNLYSEKHDTEMVS